MGTAEVTTMYRCWNCGLIFGAADDEVEEPSRLCPACKAAMEQGNW